MESLVSNIPAGDGKIANLFIQCTMLANLTKISILPCFKYTFTNKNNARGQSKRFCCFFPKKISAFHVVVASNVFCSWGLINIYLMFFSASESNYKKRFYKLSLGKFCKYFILFPAIRSNLRLLGQITMYY